VLVHKSSYPHNSLQQTDESHNAVQGWRHQHPRHHRDFGILQSINRQRTTVSTTPNTPNGNYRR
jgi:ferric-dicitrate binding protein FerR (iron transport regulator)